MKKYGVLFLLQFIGVLVFAQSESDQKRNFFIGAHLNFGHARGEFNDNIRITNDPFTQNTSRREGYSFNILFQSKQDPWLYMGFDISNYLLDFEGDFNGDVNLETSNYLASAHYKIQLHYELTHFFKPYVKGMLGTQYMFTRTVREDFIGEDIFRGGQIDTGDWGASFGGGVGFQLRVFRKLYLDTNLLYLRGTPTEYLVRLDNPPIGRDPLDDFEPRSSAIDWLVWKIGLQIGRR